MLVAAVTIPSLIRRLGNEQFGLLTIAWAVLGYFSLFDFGLGRALTNLVARKVGANDEREIPSLVWTANILMLVLGFLGTATLFLTAPPLVHRMLNIPVALQADSLRALRVLSLSIPVVTTMAAFRGLLEAYQRFDLINIVRIPQGIATFVGPLIAVQFSVSLVPVIVVLTAVRLCGLLAYVIMTDRLLPSPLLECRFSLNTVPSLMAFGGWMTVSNLVSPIMASLDRVMVGMLLTLGAVACYATSTEIASKVLVIPSALCGVIFPAFSMALVKTPEDTTRLYKRALKYLACALLPPVLLLIVFAHWGMTIWLGAPFADSSYRVLQIIAPGVFFNGMAFVPWSLVQGAGKPQWTGKVHLLELPLYLGAFWLLVSRLGITGAAIAWTARTTFDAGIFFFLASRVLRNTTKAATSNPVKQEADLVLGIDCKGDTAKQTAT